MTMTNDLLRKVLVAGAAVAALSVAACQKPAPAADTANTAAPAADANAMAPAANAMAPADANAMAPAANTAS
jgi:hypothetical protein